jgi:hypothetical protein
MAVFLSERGPAAAAGTVVPNPEMGITNDRDAKQPERIHRASDLFRR